jgi:hypothetical protein
MNVDKKSLYASKKQSCISPKNLIVPGNPKNSSNIPQMAKERFGYN